MKRYKTYNFGNINNKEDLKYTDVSEYKSKTIPIEYKEYFKEHNLFWDSIQEYRDKGYNIHSNPCSLMIEAVFRPDKRVGYYLLY